MDMTYLKRNLESCFIISDPYTDFYQTWYKYVLKVLDQQDKIPDMYYAEIEEYALDYMYIESNLRYKLLRHQYQIGERYPFTKKTNPNKVYFHHNHLYESTESFENYIKSRLNLP